MSQYRVEMKNVHKSFGDNDVVKGVNLNVANNEVVVMIGASGAGIWIVEAKAARGFVVLM